MEKGVDEIDYGKYLLEVLRTPKVKDAKTGFREVADQFAKDVYYYILAPMGW